MEILKVEKQENESLFWEIVIILAFVLNVLLFGVIVYVAAFTQDSQMMGIAIGLSFTMVAMIFIGLKKGVLPLERNYVRI